MAINNCGIKNGQAEVDILFNAETFSTSPVYGQLFARYISIDLSKLFLQGTPFTALSIIMIIHVILFS